MANTVRGTANVIDFICDFELPMILLKGYKSID